MNEGDIVFRIGLLTFGSALMGIGVALAAASTLGADTVALLWEGMHLSMNLSLGSANLMFSMIFLIAVLLIDRKQIGIGTVISPLIEGIAMDVCGLIFLEITGIGWQMLACVCGIVLIAVGTGIYAAADVGRGPYIGITFAMNKRYGWNLTVFRIALDIGCLWVGIILGASISIGPLISVLLMGGITEYSFRYVEQRVVFPFQTRKEL